MVEDLFSCWFLSDVIADDVTADDVTADDVTADDVTADDDKWSLRRTKRARFPFDMFVW